MALGLLAAFLGGLAWAGAQGWLRPRGVGLPPPRPPEPIPAAPSAPESERVSPLFRNEHWRGLVWRREGAAEILTAALSVHPAAPTGVVWATVVQGGAPVFEEASWEEQLPLARARARMKSFLPGLDPVWDGAWHERGRAWTSEHGSWGCALIPEGAEATRVLLRRQL
jgi:hypothetical protein